MNKGPDLVGWEERKYVRAWTGQRWVLFRNKWIFVPCLKGSVFEAFIWSEMQDEVMVTSVQHKVVRGSNCLTWDEVYSETRRNP